MTKAERAAYALKRYNDYLTLAREDLNWARRDRLDGMEKEALLGLRSAAHFRRQAAEWLNRYRRTASH